MSEDRWTKVKEFIAEWFEPLGEGDGYSEKEIAEAEARLGVRLPEALREWYGFAGKWYGELQDHNRQYPLESLTLSESGALAFHTENQGVCEWTIHSEDFGRDDPPVFDDVNEVLYSPTLTEFLLTALIFETSCVDTEDNINGTAEDSTLVFLERHLRCWNHSNTGSFFGNNEALVMLSPAHDGLLNGLIYGDSSGSWFVDLYLRSEDKTEHYKNLLASEVRWK
jgi:hypothetical protein